MADYRGIFSLQQLYEEQQSDNWSVGKESSFLKPPYSIDWPFGYYAGGPGFSGVSRMDFSNDGNFGLDRGNLTFNSYLGCTSSSATGGYVSGNESGPRVATVCKTDYSNDTAVAAPKGNVNQDRGAGTGVGNIDYGWHCNGQPALTQVDRIDYSNDLATASPRGNLSFWSTGSASCGNDNYGYIFHGSRQGTGGIESVSYTDRIEYSNDLVTSSPKGYLTATVYLRGATGNANYGYCAGGKSPGNNYGTNAMAKMDYANDDTAMAPKGPLSLGRAYMGSMGNSDFGYWGGGNNPSPGNLSTQDRLTFANDTATCVARGFMGSRAPAGYLGRGFSRLANVKKPSILAVGNNGVGITTTGATVNSEMTRFSYPYGYWAGGYPAPGGDKIDRIDYANDTNAMVTTANLVASRYNWVGAASNGNYGYFAGGRSITPGFAQKSDITRLDYSNDTATTATTAILTFARRDGATEGSGIFNKDYGWFAGGNNAASGTGNYSMVEKFDFSNDTATASLQSPLVSGERNTGQCFSNANYGYVCGGYDTVNTSTIQRLDFASSTTQSTLRAFLFSTTYAGCGAANRDYGYSIMGTWAISPGANTSIERLDFSNDTGTPLQRGHSAISNVNGAANGNLQYFYVSGASSAVQRWDMSNDTQTSVLRGFQPAGYTGGGRGSTSSQSMGLPQPVKQINDLKGPLAVATPGQQYGYMAGADPAKTSVFRIDYANDTNGVGFKGNIPESRYALASTSSPHYGYIIAGYNAGGKSTVDRIDYSNDSVTAASRGNLNFQVYYGDACGNKDYGYHGNGAEWPAPRYSSRTTRIDYSNDNATSVDKGNLLPLEETAAVSNQDDGYWSGGNASGGPNFQSTNTRLDFSNDTVASVPAGNLESGRTSHFATGNASYGYFGAGKAPAASSTIQRLDYSNDTTTMSFKGPLSAVKYFGSATGNKNYGYFSGGYSPAAKSIVDRVDFANDTVTPAPTRTFLSETRYNFTATSAAKFGNPQG